MRRILVVVKLFSMLEVRATDLLQKNQISAHAAYRIAQLRQNELAIEKGKPFVDIDREHTQ